MTVFKKKWSGFNLVVGVFFVLFLVFTASIYSYFLFLNEAEASSQGVVFTSNVILDLDGLSTTLHIASGSEMSSLDVTGKDADFNGVESIRLFTSNHDVMEVALTTGTLNISISSDNISSAGYIYQWDVVTTATEEFAIGVTAESTNYEVQRDGVEITGSPFDSGIGAKITFNATASGTYSIPAEMSVSIENCRGVEIFGGKWRLKSTPDVTGDFTREVTIEKTGEEEWKVDVTVSWDSTRGTESSVTLTEYLTSWREPFFIPYTLTTASTGGGSVTTPGEGEFTYYYENVVDIIAGAAGGYVFDAWTGDTAQISSTTAASANITMLDDYSITANFRELEEVVEAFTIVGSHIWTVPVGVTEIDVLVVAGGGGGGASTGASAGGGGGGAGGLVFEESYNVSGESSISITVGGGGNAGAAGGDNDGQSGGNSVFGSLTATGGGGGGARLRNGLSGGSGGGAGSKIATGGSGTTNQGNDGGDSTADASGANPGAGGGGASAVGETVGSLGAGGAGGAGVDYSTQFGTTYGDSGWFAGGGGGGDGGADGGGGGGSGGGGDGGSNSNGQSGLANTGGGGGAAATSGHNAGNGGSGIVLIRYLQ